MSTLKTTNLQESNASGANIVLGTGSGGGATISGVTTSSTLRATTGIVTSLTAGSLTSLGAVSGTTGTFTGDVSIADKIVHAGDTNTSIRFPAADQISFETGGTGSAVEYLKLHRYSGVNFVETSANAQISLADNGTSIRSILIGDGNASSTGGLRLQAGGGSSGFGGGITLYSHANSTNAGGVYIGKSQDSAGYIQFGNGGVAPVGTAFGRIDADGFKFNGDSAAANALDDYEEGTHTVSQLGSGGGVPLSNAVAYYTKIGDICHVHGVIDVGASSGSSSVEFSLPFTSKADSGTQKNRASFALMHKYCNVDNSYKNIVGYVGQNENYWRIYNVGDNNDWHQFLSGDFTANQSEILYSLTFKVA